MKNNKNARQLKNSELRQTFRQLGLKLTHQRLEIFNILTSMEDHPSAEAVYEKVKHKIPTISFDTVYRTLALYERHGVIVRLQCFTDRVRYDPNTERHHHLVCKRCKKIVDFHWGELDKLQRPKETEGWGEIEKRYLELRGVCQDCLASRGGR